MRITFVSDTHTRHKLVTKDLRGGDLIIHAGDISSVGYPHEIEEFFKWFSNLNYKYKIFIAGNHDWGFQNNYAKINPIIQKYSGSVIYLQDQMVEIEKIKIYGAPWQPFFCDWAFNLPRNGSELEYVWNKIPENIDILITHGPPYGFLDKVIGEYEHLGCELLMKRIEIVKPKIHVFGHIHSGYGYVTNGRTHFINASVLNERYYYTQNPLRINWNKKTNNIKFYK